MQITRTSTLMMPTIMICNRTQVASSRLTRSSPSSLNRAWWIASICQSRGVTIPKTAEIASTMKSISSWGMDATGGTVGNGGEEGPAIDASSTSESDSNPPRVGLKVTSSAYTVAVTVAAVSVAVALAANESKDEAASCVVSSN